MQKVEGWERFVVSFRVKSLGASHPVWCCVIFQAIQQCGGALLLAAHIYKGGHVENVEELRAHLEAFSGSWQDLAGVIGKNYDTHKFHDFVHHLIPDLIACGAGVGTSSGTRTPPPTYHSFRGVFTLHEFYTNCRAFRVRPSTREMGVQPFMQAP